MFCRNEDGVMLSAGDTFDDDCNTWYGLFLFLTLDNLIDNFVSV